MTQYSNKETILVTGGTGTVGKHLKDILPNAIYIGSRDCNLLNSNEVYRILQKYKPTTVIHLAARVGGIVDNIKKPVEYIEDNILMNTNILRQSYQCGVSKFIGVLSTCAYPDIADIYPMHEKQLHDGPPSDVNLGYGYTKRMLAVQIDAYNKQYNTKYQYLIPCNLYSEYDNFYDEDKMHFVTALLKKIISSNGEQLTFHGSGIARRQFMYAGDLAYIIKYVIDNNITESFNVAYPENLTIDDMIAKTLKALNIDKKYVYLYDGLDGQYRKDVAIDKLLAIAPNYTFTKFEDGIKLVYNKLKNEN